MTEVVLVPAWRRADFLLATLTRLRLSDIGQSQVRILIDRDPFPDVVIVAREFARDRIGTEVRLLPSHGYRGNSFNVLTGYRDAVDDGADLVHLVEEDVFVGSDYFESHRRAHELCPDVFAVSLCRDHGPGPTPPPDETAVYRHGWYQSLGVSLKRNRLAAVLAHATPDYFTNQYAYCARTFPGTRIQAGHCEQDGLLNRVREQHGWETAFAAVPRAYHAGFVGINRLGVPLLGPVAARAEQLLRMTAADLNAHARQHKDHTTVALDAPREPLSTVTSLT